MRYLGAFFFEIWATYCSFTGRMYYSFHFIRRRPVPMLIAPTHAPPSVGAGAARRYLFRGRSTEG